MKTKGDWWFLVVPGIPVSTILAHYEVICAN
jgi:hypothetical protein